MVQGGRLSRPSVRFLAHYTYFVSYRTIVSSKITFNEMTFDLDICHAGSPRPYVGQGRRLRLWVKIHSPRTAMDSRVCRVLCAKVVGATSSEGFLIH